MQAAAGCFGVDIRNTAPLARLAGLTVQTIHNYDAHNADDDHGGNDKGEEKSFEVL